MALLLALTQKGKVARVLLGAFARTGHEQQVWVSEISIEKSQRSPSHTKKPETAQSVIPGFFLTIKGKQTGCHFLPSSLFVLQLALRLLASSFLDGSFHGAILLA